MKEYNPKIDGNDVVGCACWYCDWCCAVGMDCPVGEEDNLSIPTNCPARGEGILIQVKE